MVLLSLQPHFRRFRRIVQLSLHFLSIFFRDQYQLTKVQAGDCTTFVILFGSFLRPVGGALADRMGGYRLLVVLLGGVALCMAGIASLPSAALALTFLAFGMGMLGMGNGSVFQLVPQRFPASVGILTGIVDAAGGLGGFVLPSALGLIKGRTGSFGIGFALLASFATLGMVVLVSLRALAPHLAGGSRTARRPGHEIE